MYEVIYTVMQHNGAPRFFTRKFHDEDIAKSEEIFSKGTKLTSGEKITDVTMKKVKK